MTKTILVNIQNSFSVRNFLRTDALKIINSRTDVRLVLLVKEEKVDYYKKEFPPERVFFDIMPEIENLFFERFFKFVEVASIHTHTVTMMQETEFYRDKTFFLKKIFLYFTKRCLWFFGQFKIWRRLLRKTYYAVPTNSFDSLFKKYNPDLVFCPSLLYANNRLVKEARKNNIKTIGAVLSWDNFFSKSLLRVFPDKLIAYTDDIKKQAEDYGDFPSDKIVVTGLPQYDRYFKKEGLKSREEFFSDIGGDLIKN